MTTPITIPITVVPVLEIDYMEPKRWVGRTLVSIRDELEVLRVKAKSAVNYMWDNSHYRITDIYGQSSISFLVAVKDFYMWSVSNKQWLPPFVGNIFTSEAYSHITKFLDGLHEHKAYCLGCKTFVDEYKSYDFSGAVCLKCYDPKKHLPPDTRGD